MLQWKVFEESSNERCITVRDTISEYDTSKLISYNSPVRFKLRANSHTFPSLCKHFLRQSLNIWIITQ